MSKWFLINILLLIIASWRLVIQNWTISGHIVLGFIGMLLFLFNWTRHAVFSTIRNAPKRKIKIRFASISKKVMPIHRWTGTAALIFVVFHAILVLHRYGFSLKWTKMGVGLLSGLLLLAMVTTGWWRLIRPTVQKRWIHLYIGMTLFFSILLHLLL